MIPQRSLTPLKRQSRRAVPINLLGAAKYESM
jgi:hypothetical protein